MGSTEAETGAAPLEAGVSTSEPVGRVLRIQRLSTEDGPGIRSTAFLKGCGLACRWCHNPESLSFAPEIQWTGVGCLGCGICVDTCGKGALEAAAGEITVHHGKCDGCGECIRECPTGALEMLGREWTAEELVSELVKDRSFFEQSGGGITLSGGEAALQPIFTREVLKKAKERGLETALDTCGHIPSDVLESLLPFTDLVLYDLKLMDPEKHREATGADNRLILENLKMTAGKTAKEDGSSRMWIRTPVIPGMTDSDENIRDIGIFIASLPSAGVERWELCAFNNLCRDKYGRLGIEWEFAETPLLRRPQMEKAYKAACSVADGNGMKTGKIRWTGTVRD